jgi:hypothetical protein
VAVLRQVASMAVMSLGQNGPLVLPSRWWRVLRSSRYGIDFGSSIAHKNDVCLMRVSNGAHLPKHIWFSMVDTEKSTKRNNF